MMMRTWVIAKTGVMVGALAVLGLGALFAEDQGNRGQRGNWTPEQIRQRQMERIKEALKPTDEEWKALQPKLEKVVTLSREAGLFGGRGTFGRRGAQPAGGTEAGGAAAAQSEVDKAADELQKTLDKEGATAEEIKAKTTALQDARGKAKQQLAEAKVALRDGLSQRQEAQLVLLGVLD